jgi:hypothetical protein
VARSLVLCCKRLRCNRACCIDSRQTLVRLDGTAADCVRLAAANDIAVQFHSRVIGLFLNLLPVIIPRLETDSGIDRFAFCIHGSSSSLVRRAGREQIV